MSIKSENYSFSAEFESPIEFVLIATIGKERAVVAKSKNAKIDLASYAHELNNAKFHSKSYFIQHALFPKEEDLRPMVASSFPLKNPISNDYDERSSEITLVWRGAGERNTISRIEELLNKIGPLFIHAYEIRSRTRIEWLLSPIIAHCNDAVVNERHRRFRSAAFLKLMIATTLTYALAATAIAFYYKFL